MAIVSTINIPSGQNVTVTQNAPVQIQISEQQAPLNATVTAGAITVDKNYVHAINVNDWTAVGDEWTITITHGLNKFSSITVVDSFKQTQYPNVEHVDAASVKVFTKGKFSGSVYFN